MKNSKKWLGLGAGALVLIALAVAATYNTGSFFSGSVAQLSTAPNKVITTIDVGGQKKNLKINSLYLDKQVLTYSANTLNFSEANLAAAGLSSDIEFAIEDAPIASVAIPSVVIPMTTNTYTMTQNATLAPVSATDNYTATQDPTVTPVDVQQTVTVPDSLAPVATDTYTAAPTASYTMSTPSVETYTAAPTANYTMSPAATETYTAAPTANYTMSPSSTEATTTTTQSNTIKLNPQVLKYVPPSAMIPSAHADVANEIIINKDPATNTFKANFTQYPSGVYHVKYMDGAVLVLELDISISSTCSDIDSFKFKNQSVSYTENDANKLITDEIIGIDNGVDLPAGSKYCWMSLKAMGIGQNIKFSVEEQSNPANSASTTIPPGGPVLGGFVNLSNTAIEMNFANLAVGGTIGTLSFGKNYYLNISSNGNKINALPLSINLVPAAPSPNAKIVAIASSSGVAQKLLPGDTNKKMLEVSVRNISGADQTLTKAVFSALVKADATGDYEENKDTSANVEAVTLFKDYHLDFEPAKVSGYDVSNGTITFDGLNLLMPNGATTTFTLITNKVNAINEFGRHALEEDTSVKFFLKDFLLANPAVVTGNDAGKTAGGLQVSVLPKDCTKVTSFDFDADLTYNANSPVSPQNTDLSAYDGATKLSLAGSDFCKADLVNLGLDKDTSGLFIELKDSSNIAILSDKMSMDNNPGPNIELLNKFLTLTFVTDANGKSSFRFANDFSKLNIGSANGPQYGNKYTVTVRAIAGDKVTVLPNNIAKYGIELIGPTVKLPQAPIQLPQQPQQQPVQQPVQQPTQPATVVTTTPTQPSTEPCKVGDKTFYLAGGPNSSYCKDLQSLVTPTGESTVFKVDQPAATPQVRYTTALAVQRILLGIITENKLDARIRIKHLDDDGWYNGLADARTIKSASSQEISDFKSVYASGILRGRVNPLDKSEVTLAPLERIRFIELLSLFKQGYSSVIGYVPSLRDSELPTFALAYKNDPNKVWMYEAIAFGIEFDLIGKNDFDENSIQDYATRADMADYLANFKDTIESNPSLLEK